MTNANALPIQERLRSSCYLAFDDGSNDYATASEAADRIDALEKALRWQADVIRKNLSENGLDKHRLFLDGTYHEGPVVDWVHEVLTGFENINRAALGEGE